MKSEEVKIRVINYAKELIINLIENYDNSNFDIIYVNSNKMDFAKSDSNDVVYTISLENKKVEEKKCTTIISTSSLGTASWIPEKNRDLDWNYIDYENPDFQISITHHGLRVDVNFTYEEYVNIISKMDKLKDDYILSKFDVDRVIKINGVNDVNSLD